MNLGKNKYIIDNYLRRKDDVLKLVVTDGTTEIARSFVYRVLCDNVFGENQSIFVSLYELPDKATFLESVVIELTSFSSNLLNGNHKKRNCKNGISYGHDASIEFKDADVVVCIGFAREYDFKIAEYPEPFFEEYVHVSKFYGETIEKYVKKDAKLIVLGNTTATIISKYAKSIPPKNITTLSLVNLNIVAAQIAEQANCLPTEIKNIIIWGSNGSYSFPDCRYMYFKNKKSLSDDVKVWIREILPSAVSNVSNRPSHIRSIAYGLAQHCKILWHGTPENEWTCMGVLSDHFYSIQSGIFFSFPVTCKDRQYKVVMDLDDDRYIKKYIMDLSRLISREVQVAFEMLSDVP